MSASSSSTHAVYTGSVHWQWWPMHRQRWLSPASWAEAAVWCCAASATGDGTSTTAIQCWSSARHGSWAVVSGGSCWFGVLTGLALWSCDAAARRHRGQPMMLRVVLPGAGFVATVLPHTATAAAEAPVIVVPGACGCCVGSAVVVCLCMLQQGMPCCICYLFAMPWTVCRARWGGLGGA